VAELDGLWIAAVLAADADLQVGRVLRPLAVAIFTRSPTPA